MFELHVDAASLVLLLTAGVPFFLGTGTVSKVHFQPGHLGWRTDDLLIEAVGDGAHLRKVAVQVKRTFTVSVRDADCVVTFRKAFSDFRNTELFSADHDRLGLVASMLSETTVRALRSLLDCARSALSSDDLIHRLGLPAYLGKPTLSYYRAIAEILQGVEGQPPSQDEIWRFLRVFDVVGLDLGTPGSTVEALLKSLLAATLSDASVSAAAETWNELLAIASQGSGVAASFDREKLPARLRDRHRPVTGEDAVGLARLAEDTAIVSRDVKTAIAGAVELPRRDLLSKLCQLINENQVVLVTGEAGSGKSALAKKAFTLISEGGLGVAFRSESLAGPHINQTLFPHGLTLLKLSRYFAVHGPKILWIESVERLLERLDRAAFRDLLHALKADPAWKLLVTCRDYSADTVKSAFFGDVGLPSTRLAVGELEDVELDEVAAALPALSRPLSDQGLRRLLKKPFLLDKAAQMQWSAEQPLPQNEREFRAKVWREVIRREDEASGGMPQLRSTTFIEVALRRARALEPFVAGDDLNADALFRLRRDSLLTSPHGDELRLAPAHDVLEDWALLQWLDGEFLKAGQSLREFLTRIGTYPALRRAYRKWLRESLDAEPHGTDKLILDVVCDPGVAVHWREDTLVGVLLSNDGGGFLQRNKAALLKDGAALFRQMIHLLRVAGKAEIPRTELGMSGEGDVFLPIGPAWYAAAEIMEQGMSDFSDGDAQFVLGFLKDWVLLTHWGIHYPKGSRSIAKIALRWLPKFTSWRREDEDAREELLKVLLSIPGAAATEITTMVDEALTGERLDRDEKTLLHLVFSHLYGNAVCRDMPKVTLRVAEHLLEMDDSNRASRKRRPTSERREMEHAFGFDRRWTHEDFPPSAFNGPYLPLLWHHPAVGLNFILRLLNRSCDAYGSRDTQVEFVEPPGRVAIELPDGTTREQWGNSRLWGLYRGHTVGPYCLQSALMALERWLLNKAERNDADLQEVLTLLLKESNNVAITAVVASVAIAYPYSVGDAGYSVLTCRYFFDADVERMVHDSSRAFGGLGFGVEKTIYRDERREAARLPHRRNNLRQLAVLLQTTSLREKIFALIDRYNAELPPETEQDDETRVWRLQLHDMDIRHFVVSAQTEDGRVIYQPTTPPPELQRVRDEARPRHEANEAIMGLLMWGINVFEGKTPDTARPEDWREKLVAAQNQPTSGNDSDDDVYRRMAISAPVFVATICIRNNHWNELSEAERNWCATLVCDAVDADADTVDFLRMVARNPMDGSRPAAFILPSLFDKKLPEPLKVRLLPTLAKALTHSAEEVIDYAVQGIASYLWPVDRALALTCLHALTVQAQEKDRFFHEQCGMPFDRRQSHEKFEAELREDTRRRIESRSQCDEKEILNLDITHWPGRAMAGHLLQVFSKQASDPLAVEFMKRAASTMAAAWKEGRRSRATARRHHDDEEEGIDIELEHLLVDQLSGFALKVDSELAITVCHSLLDLSADEPRKVADFLNGLILAQDGRPPTKTFWVLWQRVADGCLSRPVAFDANDRRYSDHGTLLDKLFFGLSWGEERDWAPLHGEVHRIRELFDRLPSSPAAIRAYARFLAKIGQPTLPDALCSIAAKLETDPVKLLTPESVWYLETVLRRLISGGNRRIRSELQLRESVLRVLDGLVAVGSSVAYKLRDDFITPATAGAPASASRSAAVS